MVEGGVWYVGYCVIVVRGVVKVVWYGLFILVVFIRGLFVVFFLYFVDVFGDVGDCVVFVDLWYVLW